ncbi:MAG: GNAT family N-acetyltransferase [Acidobacteriota bacterium]
MHFRPLAWEDLPLLVSWLSAPHVDAWWHEPVDLAAARAKYGPRIEGREPTHVYLVLADERPIGWIQWYRWADYPDHAAKLGARSDEAGVDLAIGDAELVGRGIGTRLLAGFVDEVVFSDPGIAGCVSDPSRATRAPSAPSRRPASPSRRGWSFRARRSSAW